jgi:hypothetical protein
MKQLNLFYKNQPLATLIVASLFVRLIAVFLSQGYAMHDDHFLIIESSSSWSHGKDYNKWLPSTQQAWVDLGWKDEVRPEGHSLVYPGIHYLMFELMNYFGLQNPKNQMYLVRLFHAFLGLWLVYLVFRFSEQISNKSNALTIAWVAALGWAMPFLSVRNLVEIVCIPFMFLALIHIQRGMNKDALKNGVIAGLFIAIAIAIRYQLFVFFGVLGLVILFQKHIKLGFAILLGFVIGFGLLQGFLDYWIWGYPFAEMIEYFSYNAGDARFDYAQSTSSFWGFNYWLVLSFITVPILGLLWFFGFFLQWKKQLWLFVPALAFLVFHMAYVNVQERFIFPIMHLVLILGVIGWSELRDSSSFWKFNPRFWNSIVKVSWSLNVILLVFMVSYFGKKARVEAAHFLYSKSHYTRAFQENTVDGFIPLLPMHYASSWDIDLVPITDTSDFKNHINLMHQTELIFFHGQNNLQARVDYFKNNFGDLVFIREFKPSWQDRLIQWLNPVNRNDGIFLYEIVH